PASRLTDNPERTSRLVVARRPATVRRSALTRLPSSATADTQSIGPPHLGRAFLLLERRYVEQPENAAPVRTRLRPSGLLRVPGDGVHRRGEIGRASCRERG